MSFANIGYDLDFLCTRYLFQASGLHFIQFGDGTSLTDGGVNEWHLLILQLLQ